MERTRKKFKDDSGVLKMFNAFFTYFRKQWLKLDNFFSLACLPQDAPHTTNNCESYHSAQKLSRPLR
ncbi:hypothetical protein Ddc_10835 [Ditylenchus destructor]|nr:hypothetical protein Ddc_10835 [Ditylenchus destructor]